MASQRLQSRGAAPEVIGAFHDIASIKCSAPRTITVAGALWSAAQAICPLRQHGEPQA